MLRCLRRQQISDYEKALLSKNNVIKDLHKKIKETGNSGNPAVVAKEKTEDNRTIALESALQKKENELREREAEIGQYIFVVEAFII